MSLVQVHSTCWAHCWQRSETALAIAEVVEDHKHSRVAQLSLGAHDARFKRKNRALPIGGLSAAPRVRLRWRVALALWRWGDRVHSNDTAGERDWLTMGPVYIGRHDTAWYEPSNGL